MAKLNCGSMFHLWYLLLVGALHILLTLNAIRRYMAFKSLALDGAYGLQWSEVPQNLYLFCIVFALSLIPCMLYTSVAWTGNYANDGLMLGVSVPLPSSAATRDTRRSNGMDSKKKSSTSDDGNKEQSQHHKSTASQRQNKSRGETQSKLRQFCVHVHSASIPWFAFLHFVVAYLFVLPLPVLRAHLIKHRVIDYEEYIWRCPLEQEVLAVSPHRVSLQGLQPPSEMLEVLNLVLALLLIVYHYGNIFWFTHKVFAILFSLLITALSVEIVFQFFVMYVLYGWLFNNASPSTLEHSKATLLGSGSEPGSTPSRRGHTPSDPMPYFLPSEVLLAVVPLVSIAFLLCLVPVCQYGLHHFRRGCPYFSTIMTSTFDEEDRFSDEDRSSRNNDGEDDDLESDDHHRGRRTKRSQRSKKSHQTTSTGLKGHWVMVSGLVLVLFAASLETPLICECLYAYRDTQRSIFLVNALYNVILISLWLVLWLAFSLKTNWAMKTEEIPRVNTTTSSLGGVLAVGNHLGSAPSYEMAMSAGLIHRAPYASSSGLSGMPMMHPGSGEASQRVLDSSSPVSPLYAGYFDVATGGVGLPGTAHLQTQLAIASGLHPSVLCHGLQHQTSAGSNNINGLNSSIGDCYSEDTDGSGSRHVDQDRGNYVFLQGAIQPTPLTGYHPTYGPMSGTLPLHPVVSMASPGTTSYFASNPAVSGNYMVMPSPQLSDAGTASSATAMLLGLHRSPMPLHKSLGEALQINDQLQAALHHQQQQAAVAAALTGDRSGLVSPASLMKTYADYSDFHPPPGPPPALLNVMDASADSQGGGLLRYSAVRSNSQDATGGANDMMVTNVLLENASMAGSVFVGANHLLQTGNTPEVQHQQEDNNGTLSRNTPMFKQQSQSQQNGTTPVGRRGSTRMVTFKEDYDSQQQQPLTGDFPSLGIHNTLGGPSYGTSSEEGGASITNSLLRRNGGLSQNTSSSDSGIENQTPRLLSQQTALAHMNSVEHAATDGNLDPSLARYFHDDGQLGKLSASPLMPPGGSPRINHGPTPSMTATSNISPPMEYGAAEGLMAENCSGLCSQV